jgi:hypothetical protein
MARPGEHVVVPISASTAQSLTLLAFHVSFDPALCSVIENQTITPTGRTAVTPQEGGIACPADGRLTIGLLDLGGGVVLPSGNGPIINWGFDVSPGATNATFPLALTVDQAFNGAVPIPVGASSGQLAITECFLDVDMDGLGSVATDIVYIARHLLGLPPVPASFRQGDPNIPPDAVISANIGALCP